MIICEQEMKVTLTIHGKEMSFSEQELIAFLERHVEPETILKVIQVPTEEKWFEVNPQAIDQSVFQEKRNDVKQEVTRKLILEAFAEVKKYPEKYGRKFETMMPKYTWVSKTASELDKLACELGSHNADWVEQALEWAQRICNGEKWEAICNHSDTSSSYRMIVWKSGNYRLVGGSRIDESYEPASSVFCYDETSKDVLYNTVPLVVK